MKATTPEEHQAVQKFVDEARLAQEGDAEAQFSVAFELLVGNTKLGLERNIDLGVEFLKLAAVQGHSHAQRYYGGCLIDGTWGVKANPMVGIQFMTRRYFFSN